MTAIAMVDYGMGNRRSVAKAFEHVGTPIAQTADPDELRAADGLVVPGVGAFPEAMRRLRALGLDEVVRGARAGRQAGHRAVPRHAAALRALGRARGLRRARACWPGEVVRLDPRGLKLPHIGWNSVHWERPSALVRGAAGPGRLLPRAHVRGRARGPVDRARPRRVRLAVRLLRRVGQRLRRAVPSGEVLDARPRAAAQLRRHLRVGPRA